MLLLLFLVVVIKATNLRFHTLTYLVLLEIVPRTLIVFFIVANCKDLEFGSGWPVLSHWQLYLLDLPLGGLQLRVLFSY